MTPALLPDDHPLLRQRMPIYDFAAPDAKPTAVAIANTLLEAMKHHGGVGLAANQIGLDVRAFAIELADGPIVMFNPLVTWLSQDSVVHEEGCLTFTDIWLKISRPKECQISYDDEAGNHHVVDLKGMEARCALHETDHLDGIVFIGKVSKLRLSMARKKAQKFQKKP